MDESRNEAVDRISELPHPILDQILSKVKPQYAARTSVLSKTWKSVYDSFPEVVLNENFIIKNVKKLVKSGKLSDKEKLKYMSNMEQFNDRHRLFPDGIHSDVEKNRILLEMIIRETFMLLSNNSFKRINGQEMVLGVLKFKIWIEQLDEEFASLIDDWIGLITRRNIKGVDITIDITSAEDPKSRYDLPQTILNAKSLTVIKLQGCRLDSSFTSINAKLPSLQELYLDFVDLNEQILENLISTFPCIQIFALHCITGLTHFRISALHKLKVIECSFSTNSWVELEEVNIEAPSLDYLFFSYTDRSEIFKFNVEACLQNLTRLCLSSANLTEQLLQELISKISLLETLRLNYCVALKRVNISSHTLVRLSLSQCRKLEDLKIDAPNLRFFLFSSIEETIPLISLVNSNSISKLQVDLYFVIYHTLGAKWLINLRHLLANFGCIKTLRMSIHDMEDTFIEELPDVSIPPPSEVSLLELQLYTRVTIVDGQTVKKSFDTAALADALLWTCRPKTIMLRNFGDKFIDFIKCCFGKLENKEDLKSCNASAANVKHWENQLEEVKIRIEDEDNDVIEYDKTSWNEFLEAMPTYCNLYLDFQWQKHPHVKS